MTRPPGIRRACSVLTVLTVLTVSILLAGCSHTETLKVAAVPTLPPPTPVGMDQMSSEPPLPPDDASQDCNATASLDRKSVV